MKQETDLKPGDLVMKTSGDYTFYGVVLAVFPKRSGAIRVAVENNDGLIHIFNPSQLTHMEMMPLLTPFHG